MSSVWLARKQPANCPFGDPAMAATKASDMSANLEPVNIGLRSIKQIRSNVKDLFKLLADGNQSVYESNRPDEECGDFLNDLQGLVNNINQRVCDLETSVLLTTSNIVSECDCISERRSTPATTPPHRTSRASSMRSTRVWA